MNVNLIVIEFSKDGRCKTFSDNKANILKKQTIIWKITNIFHPIEIYNSKDYNLHCYNSQNMNIDTYIIYTFMFRSHSLFYLWSKKQLMYVWDPSDIPTLTKDILFFKFHQFLKNRMIAHLSEYMICMQFFPQHNHTVPEHH